MNKNTLYHYTNAKGLRGILNTKKLNPSLKTNNPQDARYGNGQYLSDIIPNTKTCAQLSRCFIGQPFQGNKFSHYIEIDITKFHIIKTKKNVFVIPNTKPINLTKIIISYGENL